MNSERGSMRSTVAVLLIIAVAIIGAFFFGFRIVDQGEICVIVRLGKVAGTAKTGFSWVPRVVNNFACYDRRGVMYQTAPNAQGSADYMDWPVTANTLDGQQVSVTVNVVFHVGDAEFVYGNVGEDMPRVKERVVANFTRSTIRDVAAFYHAEDLYTSGRIEYAAEIYAELKEAFGFRGVELDSFELRSIVFDPNYVASIEAQQIAEENIETKRYEAQQAVHEAERAAALAKGEADARIERARGEAEAKVLNATADATATILAAEAEAEAITLKGDALATNPEVLQWEFIANLASANWLAIPWDALAPFLPLDIMN